MQTLSPRPVMLPYAAFKAALATGYCTIAIVGDSISEGASLYFPNTYAQNLTQMLKREIPSVVWNVVNLSIGGYGMSNLVDPGFVAGTSFSRPRNSSYDASQVWPNGSSNGVSWRDHVKALAPDLIILALGMNDGTDAIAFCNNLNTFVAYTQTWAKHPWFTLNACYLPTSASAPYSTFQVPGQAMADTMRSLALMNGFGLIDPNAIYRYLNDGVTREYIPQIQESGFRYYPNTASWMPETGGAISLANGVATMTNNRLIRLISARDIDLLCSCTPADNTSVFRISYRLLDPTSSMSGYSVQWDSSNGGEVTLYYGANLVASQTSVGFSASTMRTLRVKASGELHEVWLDNFPLISYKSVFGLSAGAFSAGLANGSGTLNPAFLYGADFIAVTPPPYTFAQLMGTTNDIYTNPDSVGGNGINHLSTLGTHLVYVTAVNEWLREIQRLMPRVRTAYSRDASAISYSNAVYANIPGCAITLKNDEDSTVRVDISIGYKNPGASNGRIQLLVDGAVAETWVIPSGGSPTAMGTFNAHYFGPILAGVHNYQLQWSIGNFSSGGDWGSTRYFAVTTI